jgi:prepilin-type N-terminal cleavage/methylation domain-containing protein
VSNTNANYYRGVTLIEILVSIVILSVVSLGSIVFFSYGRQETHAAKINQFAQILAEDQMEMMRGKKYTEVSGSFTTNVVNTQQTFYRLSTTYKRFFGSRLVAVNSLVNQYTERYKVVTVTVTWVSDAGAQGESTLYTIISEDINRD